MHVITAEKSICSFHRIFFKNAFHQILRVASVANLSVKRLRFSRYDVFPGSESVGYGFRKKFSVNLMVGEQLIHIKEIFHAAIAFVSVNHCVKLFCY